MIAMVQKTKTGSWMDELEGGTVILMEKGALPHSDTVSLVKAFANKGYKHGIIVSLDTDCPSVLAACKGLEHKAVTCFHEGRAVDESKHQGCIIIPTLDSLTDLGILLVEKIRAMPPGGSFCILDSLSTLEKHNKPDLVARFVQFLNSKLKTAKIDAVMLDSPRPNDALKPLIINLFDHVVEKE